jgi:hypothetical protein
MAAGALSFERLNNCHQFLLDPFGLGDDFSSFFA